MIPLDESQTSITTSSYRVAQGGMEYVKIYTVRSMEKLLRSMSKKMFRVGTDVNAKTPVTKIKSLAKNKPLIIVLGNEEHGISDETKRNCDELVIIPYGSNASNRQIRRIESLNVAQAAAIVLFAATSLD